VRYFMTEAAVAPEDVNGDTVHVRRLFDETRGCEKFAQRILMFDPGRSGERLHAAADETLYVLDGSGTVAVGGDGHPVEAGTSVYVGKGTPWAVETDDGVEVLSVLVFDPEPVPEGSHAVVDLAHEQRLSATASRQFSIGLDPDVGCMSVTQFVGFIPPGRAPDHYHHYDEVLYVLEGEGTLHIDGEQEHLAPGASVHLPARLVHCLENTGDTEMQVCAVFRPAGSPAEAYYPDGRPAVYVTED